MDVLLRRMAVVLAPSLWLEAWGMVVTEAALRGLPTLVSNAGGLPEAGLGCSTVVAVETVRVPEDPASGTPDWSRRTYPTQQVCGGDEGVRDRAHRQGGGQTGEGGRTPQPADVMVYINGVAVQGRGSRCICRVGAGRTGWEGGWARRQGRSGQGMQAFHHA